MGVTVSVGTHNKVNDEGNRCRLLGEYPRSGGRQEQLSLYEKKRGCAGFIAERNCRAI